MITNLILKPADRWAGNPLKWQKLLCLFTSLCFSPTVVWSFGWSVDVVAEVLITVCGLSSLPVDPVSQRSVQEEGSGSVTSVSVHHHNDIQLHSSVQQHKGKHSITISSHTEVAHVNMTTCELLSVPPCLQPWCQARLTLTSSKLCPDIYALTSTSENKLVYLSVAQVIDDSRYCTHTLWMEWPWKTCWGPVQV